MQSLSENYRHVVNSIAVLLILAKKSPPQPLWPQGTYDEGAISGAVAPVKLEEYKPDRAQEQRDIAYSGHKKVHEGEDGYRVGLRGTAGRQV